MITKIQCYIHLSAESKNKKTLITVFPQPEEMHESKEKNFQIDDRRRTAHCLSTRAVYCRCGKILFLCSETQHDLFQTPGLVFQGAPAYGVSPTEAANKTSHCPSEQKYAPDTAPTPRQKKQRSGPGITLICGVFSLLCLRSCRINCPVRTKLVLQTKKERQSHGRRSSRCLFV